MKQLPGLARIVNRADRWRREHPEKADVPVIAFGGGALIALLAASLLTTVQLGPAAALAGGCLALALATLAFVDFIIKVFWKNEETFYLVTEGSFVQLLGWVPPIVILIVGFLLGHLLWT